MNKNDARRCHRGGIAMRGSLEETKDSERRVDEETRSVAWRTPTHRACVRRLISLLSRE